MILFYTTGSHTEGLGHIFRTLALIKVLLVRELSFFCVVNESPIVESLFREHQISVSFLSNLENILQTNSIHSLVIDTRRDVSEAVRLAKQYSVPIVMLDCLTPARLWADINIYPNPHFDWHALDWKTYNGQIFGGALYTILHQKFQDARENIPAVESRNRILVSFGGSDPNGVTQRVLPWLIRSAVGPIDVVIGPGFQCSENLYALASDEVSFHENCSNLVPLMLQSRVLITALGVTIYEAALLQLPSIILSNFHSDFVDEVQIEKFIGIFPLGYYEQVLEVDFLRVLRQVLQTPSYQAQVGTLLDGLGAERIIDILI